MNERGLNHIRTSSPGLDNFTGDYLPSSSFVAVTAVPEPSTLVLVAIGKGSWQYLRAGTPEALRARLTCPHEWNQFLSSG